MNVYKIIDVVGTSKKSFSDAAKNAIIESVKTVKKIRRAEVTKLDVKVENDTVTLYRAEMKISFEIERYYYFSPIKVNCDVEYCLFLIYFFHFFFEHLF